MVITELTLPTTVWLQKGLRLKPLLVELAGTPLVESYVEVQKAFRSLPYRRPGSRPSNREEWQLRTLYDERHQSCVAPLVNALNSGRIIAVRPDYNRSEFVPLLPPAVGWCFRICDLEQSLIFDPRKLDQALFVLFMVADREPAQTLQPVTTAGPAETTFQSRQSSRPTKSWLKWAVANIPPDDWERGWKKRYAQKLATMTTEEVKTNKNIKPLEWTSISARLTEHKLWPILKQHD
jgi:hypothetical protein